MDQKTPKPRHLGAMPQMARKFERDWQELGLQPISGYFDT
jgi:hypothetical protein